MSEFPAARIVRAKPPRRRLGLAVTFLGLLLLAVPALALVYGRMIALALGGSLEALAGVLDLPLGGWEGSVPPGLLGAAILAGSLLLLAIPGLALFALGVSCLRRAT